MQIKYTKESLIIESDDSSSKDNKSIFKYSKERPIYINILFFLVAFIGTFVLPSLFSELFLKIIKSAVVSSLLGNLTFIILLYLMYKKDLDKEFKTFINEFKNNFKTGFKYYLAGLGAMMVFNLFISIIIKDVSTNESLVREMLFKMPVYTMISISIIAPLSEEFTFRKSLEPLIKNKWIYALSCGLLFAACHLVAGEFKLINLLYLLPYGSLGFVFALMDKKTNTTCTSVMMHMIHNTMTGVLLLLVYKMGAL